MGGQYLNSCAIYPSRCPTHSAVLLKLTGSSKSKLDEGMSFTGIQANLQVIDIELCQTGSLLRNMGEKSNNSAECARILMRVYSISRY